MIPADANATQLLVEFLNQPTLKLIHGSLTEADKIHKCIRDVDAVVCMLSPDALTVTQTKKKYVKGYVSDFVNLLYPLMKKESSIQVFLFQVRIPNVGIPVCLPRDFVDLFWCADMIISH